MKAVATTIPVNEIKGPVGSLLGARRGGAVSGISFVILYKIRVCRALVLDS
jgi:hypothetical protein